MASSQNQKMKLLYLMKILLEETDENHPITVAGIITMLSEYNIKAERKSLYSDIEVLREFGIDIEMVKSKSVGYYVADRKFEIPELKLLVDAVCSSRFITAKKSNELIKKISTLASRHQAKTLKRQILTAEQPKPLNENIYYSIDTIHEAINGQYKIIFKYFDYNADKRRVFRKSGDWYVQTPIALCWNEDKYYLICFSDKYQDFTHYRVDRMNSVTISDKRSDKIAKSDFNLTEYTRTLFGMYSGELIHARLRFDNTLANAVLDKFGSDIYFYKLENCFEINVEVSNSPAFLSWIFQYGNRAEIVEPESLRESMKNLLEQNSKKYK